jgi:hypothetical protein
MDAELFDSELLESCRRDDARELHTAYLPSLAEIAVMKRQIRDEKEAQEGGPPQLKMCRQTRVFRTDYSQGRITREH